MIGIGKIAKNQLICVGLFCLAAFGFDQNAIAQVPTAGSEEFSQLPTKIAIKKPVVARPSSDLLGRSLGMSAGILAVGGLILLAHRMINHNAQAGSLRRVGGDNLAKGEVLQRMMLGGRQAVYVLRIGGRVLVVGTGAQEAPRLLSEWLINEGSEADSEEIGRLIAQPMPRIAGQEESAA